MYVMQTRMNGASIFAINDRAIPEIHIFVGNLPLKEIILGRVRRLVVRVSTRGIGETQI